jgi:hypothetical protein
MDVVAVDRQILMAFFSNQMLTVDGIRIIPSLVTNDKATKHGGSICN